MPSLISGKVDSIYLRWVVIVRYQLTTVSNRSRADHEKLTIMIIVLIMMSIRWSSCWWYLWEDWLPWVCSLYIQYVISWSLRCSLWIISFVYINSFFFWSFKWSANHCVDHAELSDVSCSDCFKWSADYRSLHVKLSYVFLIFFILIILS